MKKHRPKYNQIIEAAVKIIAQNGYHASQVSKIAKEAGVADGTIYLYFENKEDILVSVFKEKMGQFIRQIKKSIEQRSKATDQLYQLILMHFKQLSIDYELAIVAQLELRQSDKELRLKINHVLKEYLDIMDEVIEAGITEGVFQADLNIPLVRQMIFGTLDEIVTTWVMQERSYELEPLAKDVHTLIINGLCKNK